MKIIERLPIFEAGWIVPSPDGAEEVKPYQIVVLLSIAVRSAVILPEGTPRFPAVLDTGNNHNFSIRQGQFERWAPLILRQTGRIAVGGFSVPLLGADVWNHPNRPGTIDPSGQPPFRVELTGGIAVYPPGVPNPARLPTLGPRGLIRNRLRLIMDGEPRELTLESPSA